MHFSKQTEKNIKDIIEKLFGRVIEKRVYKEPWNYEQEKLERPFHVALVPETIWKGAKFERSFVTTLGMIGWEQIAQIIAEEKHGFAENSYEVEGVIDSNEMHKIQSLLNELEKSREPDQIRELSEIYEVNKADTDINCRVISDLYVENVKEDKHYYFEIKAPKPNSDQSKVSKEKIFKINAMHKGNNHKAFFALPYNPYIKRENYNHSHPKRWFDMHKSPLVLMGKEFWDLLGGPGTFEALIDVFEDVGEKYRRIINEEYLGLD